MILYHGSSLEVVKPDLSHSRANVDFGRGSYVTPLYEQAVKWCASLNDVEKMVLFLAMNMIKAGKMN